MCLPQRWNVAEGAGGVHRSGVDLEELSRPVVDIDDFGLLAPVEAEGDEPARFAQLFGLWPTSATLGRPVLAEEVDPRVEQLAGGPHRSPVRPMDRGLRSPPAWPPFWRCCVGMVQHDRCPTNQPRPRVVCGR